MAISDTLVSAGTPYIFLDACVHLLIPLYLSVEFGSLVSGNQSGVSLAYPVHSLNILNHSGRGSAIRVAVIDNIFHLVESIFRNGGDEVYILLDPFQ